jgi:hypothetical protein
MQRKKIRAYIYQETKQQQQRERKKKKRNVPKIPKFSIYQQLV